jgi:hypothetical protein
METVKTVLPKEHIIALAAAEHAVAKGMKPVSDQEFKEKMEQLFDRRKKTAV